WPAWSSRRATAGCAAWSRSRGRWRCSRSTAGARGRRRKSGRPGWGRGRGPAGEALGCFGLTEPDAGSDPGAMRTRARRDGDDWVLHGQKMWITNGSAAEVAVVWARTDDGIRGFLVPRGTKGFTTQDIHRK